MRDENLEKEQVLYVEMFGNFSVRYQGVSLIGKKKKRDTVCTGIAITSP